MTHNKYFNEDLDLIELDTSLFFFDFEKHFYHRSFSPACFSCADNSDAGRVTSGAGWAVPGAGRVGGLLCSLTHAVLASYRYLVVHVIHRLPVLARPRLPRPRPRPCQAVRHLQRPCEAQGTGGRDSAVTPPRPALAIPPPAPNTLGRNLQRATLL